MRNLFLFLLIIFSFPGANAQIWNEVRTILHDRCSSCHSGPVPSGLLDLDSTVSLGNLVGISPTNPAAVSNGYLRVDPGNADNSFLLRKCWPGEYDLPLAEGDSMPQSGAPLTNYERELIRQWILFGANDSADVDTAVIAKYYAGEGLPRLPRPPAPGPGTLQVHFGPFFVEGAYEQEYFLLRDLNLSDTAEVTGFNISYNPECHHFLLFNDLAMVKPPGLRAESHDNTTGLESELIQGWVNPEMRSLPTGTAFFIPPASLMDLNMHVLNYNPDSVLMAEGWVDIITQPFPSGATEMFASMVPIDLLKYTFLPGWELGQSLVIPPGWVTLSDTFYLPVPMDDPYWNIWALLCHTHGLGIDFDIYVREWPGVKGPQIYEGFMDPTYTFNQGYYDFEHPPYRVFDPLYQVQMQTEGFIFDAQYFNPGPDTVRFGPSVTDEMMHFFIQYTVGDSLITGVESYGDSPPLPNPSSAPEKFEYFDLQGRKTEPRPGEWLIRRQVREED